MTTSPFQIADKYVTLKKQCIPPSWGDTVILLNEMIVAPIATFFFAFIGQGDLIGIFTSARAAYNAWSRWLEFEDLRFQVQNMYLMTMVAGGPFIRTNDPEYQAFVYADAVVRIREGLLTPDKRRPGSAGVRPPQASVQNTGSGLLDLPRPDL